MKGATEAATVVAGLTLLLSQADAKTPPLEARMGGFRVFLCSKMGAQDAWAPLAAQLQGTRYAQGFQRVLSSPHRSWFKVAIVPASWPMTWRPYWHPWICVAPRDARAGYVGTPTWIPSLDFFLMGTEPEQPVREEVVRVDASDLYTQPFQDLGRAAVMFVAFPDSIERERVVGFRIVPPDSIPMTSTGTRGTPQ